MKRSLLASAIVATILIGAHIAASTKLPGRATAYAAAVEDADAYEGPPVELLILGDSRPDRLDAALLAAALGLDPEAAVNGASTSGDFATSQGLARAWSRHLADDAIVLLGVSEYWTELVDLDDALGVLDDPLPYLAGEEYALALSAAFPLSRGRGWIVERLRVHAERGAKALSARLGWQQSPPPEASRGPDGLDRSNVDGWFGSGTDEEREARRAVGERMLASTIRVLPETARFVVVFLPNAAARERYVDEIYPGRNRRGRETLAFLAAAQRVPFVNVWDIPTQQDWFKDFHHLSKRGVREFTPLLAAAVRAKATEVPARYPSR